MYTIDRAAFIAACRFGFFSGTNWNLPITPLVLFQRRDSWTFPHRITITHLHLPFPHQPILFLHPFVIHWRCRSTEILTLNLRFFRVPFDWLPSIDWSVEDLGQWLKWCSGALQSGLRYYRCSCTFWNRDLTFYSEFKFGDSVVPDQNSSTHWISLSDQYRRRKFRGTHRMINFWFSGV